MHQTTAFAAVFSVINPRDLMTPEDLNRLVYGLLQVHDWERSPGCSGFEDALRQPEIGQPISISLSSI
ncbi:hypothetical protein [Prochlorococcus sp. MIT 1323]|uniref:hypothetical protein n=1 Tax=Prochlorococcus sp. MIT 1323 TaxID=3082526 RepID=UPI0039B387D0